MRVSPLSQLNGTVETDMMTLSCLDERSNEVETPHPSPSLRRFSELTVVIIEPRILARECLVTSLKAAAAGSRILAFSDVQEWFESSHAREQISVILLCVGNRRTKDDEIERGISRLINSPDNIPVVLLSDIEDAEQIMSAVGSGVRGFIPSSSTLDVAVEAMHLVKAGGVYIPANSLMSWKATHEDAVSSDKGSADGKFTARQYAVLKALRQGKANKIIAYELNMRESTVKVHVRNIMRKLKARNRTEVAYLTSRETTM